MIDLMLDCIKEGEQPVATSSNHYEFYYLIEQQALLIKALFATYVGLYPWLHWGAFLFGSYWPKLSNCSKFLLLFNQIYS